MGAGVSKTHGETARHTRLKRLAFLWAQAHGYSACAMEAALPQCRYRADVAADRPQPKKIGSTAIFEGKQVVCELRRDNCNRNVELHRLEANCQRSRILETC